MTTSTTIQLASRRGIQAIRTVDHKTGRDTSCLLPSARYRYPAMGAKAAAFRRRAALALSSRYYDQGASQGVVMVPGMTNRTRS